MPCAIDKQPDRIRLRNALRVPLRIRQRQRAERIGALGADAQRLPAGGDKGPPGGFAKQRLRQAGTSVEHMLAVVEHHQYF